LFVKEGLECVDFPKAKLKRYGEFRMETNTERRREQRLRYHWPVWFAEDFSEILLQGQMVDISSRGAAFTCHCNEESPYPGQQITARFSIPHFGEGDSFDMANFTRTANVCRVEDINRFLRRIAVQFAEPLPFKPGEQVGSKSDEQQRLKGITI